MQPLGAEDTRSDRIELRVTPEEKALLLRAAEIAHLDMTSFVMRAAVPAAQEVFEPTEHDKLRSAYIVCIGLLENPPQPNAKLIAAITIAWQISLEETGRKAKPQYGVLGTFC